MKHIAFKVICGAFVLCAPVPHADAMLDSAGQNSSGAAPVRAAVKAPVGGEAINGLRLTAKEEFPAGVVHCWIKNVEDHAITYNRFAVDVDCLSCYDLEVQDSAGAWARLDGEGSLNGIGPRPKDIKRLPAHKVIKTDDPEVIGNEWAFAFVTPRPPKPANWGATNIVDLVIFRWPESVLRQAKITIRVALWMPHPSSDFSSSDVERDTLRSPAIEIDGAKLRRYLARVSPDERASLFERKPGDAIPIKTEAIPGGGDKNGIEQVTITGSNGKDVATGIETTWLYDATEEAGWISVLYKDAKCALCVATFKLQEGKVAGLATEQLETFRPGDRLNAPVFERPDDVIYQRNTPEQKMADYEWRGFTSEGSRTWRQVDTSHGLSRW